MTMSDITSPARPWFRLATPDPVNGLWPSETGTTHEQVFNRSNLYRSLR